MVSVLAYSEKKKDTSALWELAEDLIARLSEEYWECRQISALNELREYLADKPLVHLMIYDIRNRDALDFLPYVRKDYPLSHLMMLADVSVSPMEYIRPGLRASSLLLKPWTKEQARSVLRDFFGEYISFVCQEKRTGQNCYIADTKEGTLNIPYEQIYFFEARQKKLYICTGKEEYGFYGTIDRVAEKLPEQFVRCHRGVIVNVGKIRKVVFSQNMICLHDGFDIPLSRSYKAAIKELVK